MTAYPRCFLFERDRIGRGDEIVAECLRQAYFGLAFMTAQVYRTRFAQEAIQAWPEGVANYDFQIFITAYVARQGRVLATSHPHVKYVTGDNIYERDKRVGLRLYADSLDVFVHLQRIGYPADLCRSLARRHLWALKKRFVKRAMTNNPLLTLETLGRALRSLTQLCLTPATPAHDGTAPRG